MAKQSFRSMLAVVAFCVGTGSAESATLYVANNALDGPSCGTKVLPCRSITAAIAKAQPDDMIIVGPGVYGGNLNENNIVGEPGEESPTPGCGCMIGINKPVTLLSSDGAAMTTIDARNIDAQTNVLLITNGGRFGKPGKGFTVTPTRGLMTGGIVIDSNDVVVAGNHVTAVQGTASRSNWTGIVTVPGAGVVTIESNLVSGWLRGIWVQGANNVVRKNSVSQNLIAGIEAHAGLIVGNVMMANGFGPNGSTQSFPTGGLLAMGASRVVDNALYGNAIGIVVDASYTGGIEGNNIFANDVRGTELSPSGRDNAGLVNRGAVGVAAANNYWGAPTGPGPNPADDVRNDAGGTTTTSPVATKPSKVKVRIK